MLRRPLVVLVLAAAASAASGCRLFRPVNPNAPAEPTPQPAARAPDAPGAAAPAPAPARRSASDQRRGLTDANIAAMVLALNNTDISYARLVPSRAERADVKEFATRMLTDHTGVNGLVNDLLAKLDVVPEDNTASLDMRDESANKRDMMRELSGHAFDSTYMANEVAYHQKFLATIDSVMIPAARHAELKGLLGAVRPAVAAHLAHAEQVRANVFQRR